MVTSKIYGAFGPCQPQLVMLGLVRVAVTLWHLLHTPITSRLAHSVIAVVVKSPTATFLLASLLPLLKLSCSLGQVGLLWVLYFEDKHARPQLAARVHPTHCVVAPISLAAASNNVDEDRQSKSAKTSCERFRCQRFALLRYIDFASP